jgi:S1 RNA binding domain protein
MELAVGQIVEGKVTGITKFGAFVSLPNGKSGMVHISEVAHAYVNDIREHLTEGQEVKVKVIAMENGKINLSIKKTMDPPPRQSRGDRSDRSNGPRDRRPANSGAAPHRAAPQPKGPQTFEDKLKQFMAESDSKISSIRQYSDHKTKNRRR